MTKFVYQMENILNIKYKMEDQAKTAYGAARMKLTEEEERMFKLKQKAFMYQERLRILMRSKLKLQDIRKNVGAFEIIKDHISQQQVNIKKAEKQLEDARIRLNNAILERKTHENLKDKAFESFCREYESEQRKEIDELVSYKYNNPTDLQEER